MDGAREALGSPGEESRVHYWAGVGVEETWTLHEGSTTVNSRENDYRKSSPGPQSVSHSLVRMVVRLGDGSQVFLEGLQ